MGKNPSDAIAQRNDRIRLSELLERDSEWCMSRMQPKTLNLIRRAMALLTEWIGDKGIKEVDCETIESFLNHLRDDLNFKPTTINMQLRQLQALFQRAVDEYGLLPEHLFRKVKQHSVPKYEIKAFYLTVEQVRKLLDSIEDKHFLRLVKFYIWTGCSRIETLELKWNEVDSLNKLIYLGQPKSKTKLRRALPTNQKLESLLEELAEDRQGHDFVFRRYADKNPSYISKRFESLRKSLEEFPNDLSPHLLRHTFASHLVMKVVDPTTVAFFLGHSTSKVTELYAHLQPDHRLMCLDRLPF